MSESLPCRPLRAGVFTLVCASLSAIGHTVCSGHDVPLFGLLLGGAIVAAMAWVGSMRWVGTRELAARMLWGQFALHVTFSTAQGWGADHQGHIDHTVTSAGEAMPAGVMITMHVVMALVSAWWLKRGEDALLAFLRFMGLSLVPLWVVGGSVPVSRRVTAPRFVPVDAPLFCGVLCLRHIRVLRGPPSVPVA